MSYLVLYSTDDGLNITHIKTKEELLKKITPDKDGYCYWGDFEEIKFLDAIPTDFYRFKDYSTNELLIVKAEVVTPRPVEVVTKMDID